MWNDAEVVVRGKAWHWTFKKKKKRTKINFLSFYLRKLEETEQGEKKKERIKYKQKATELRQETGGKKKKSMKPKAGSLKR